MSGARSDAARDGASAPGDAPAMEGRAAAGPAAPGGAAAAGVAATDAPAPDAAATGDPAEDAGVIAAPWQALRRFTAARIALGRAGVAVPTTAELEFRLAHARARDAVHLPFDAEAVAAALRADGHETLTLKSAAADRHVYLQRPDLGRRLDEASRDRLSAWRRQRGAAPDFDLALVVADGLSALAVHRHATPLVAALRPHLSGWTLAPVVLVHQGRVAIGDEIGAALGAACVVVLIGERPGLSSPDSLGLYISWAPRVGLTDAARNCISNVRPEGLAVEAAAAKLAWLLGEARRRCLTGVALKDEVDEARPRLGSDAHDNFLVDVPLGSAGVGALRAGGNGGDGNDGSDGEHGKDGGQGGGGGDGSHGRAVDPAVRSPSGQDGAITAGPESRTAVDGPKRRADAPLKAATEPATAAAAPDAGSDPGRVGDTSPPRPH